MNSIASSVATATSEMDADRFSFTTDSDLFCVSLFCDTLLLIGTVCLMSATLSNCSSVSELGTEGTDEVMSARRPPSPRAYIHIHTIKHKYIINNVRNSEFKLPLA